jgi:hypothetical protein
MKIYFFLKQITIKAVKRFTHFDSEQYSRILWDERKVNKFNVIKKKK